MDKIPFSVYDFFGYLAAGLVVVAAADFAFRSGSGLSATLGLGATFVWIVVIYVTGHIVAAISAFLLEDGFARRWLGPPEEILFRERLTGKLREHLFSNYHRALPKETIKRVLDKAKPTGIDKPGRALFLLSWAKVMQDNRVADRLSTFLNLYGFARNTSIAAALACLILVAGAFMNTKAGPPFMLPRLGWAAAALFAAIALLYRYLKFYRHYTLQVFVGYAEMA